MAVRWSNPSGSIGVKRFRVWPDGTDFYNHIDLTNNWDKVDQMIGVDPSGAEWPPTTGEDGGLYALISSIQTSSIPIGMMASWIRPSNAIPLPVGWVVCDGSTLTASEHDFTGGGSIVLPDMRNRFIIGADVSTTIGQAGVAVTDGNINNSAGAPGPQGTGGTNQVTITTSTMPSHNHGGDAWTGWSDLSLHYYTSSSQPTYPPAGNYETVTIPGAKHEHPYTGAGGWREKQHRHLLDGLSSSGSDSPHENRPGYVGLIWIMRVKNIG